MTHHGVAHQFHARLAFLRIHFQRDADRFGQLFHVVGIHNDRVAQFAGGSGELAQDQRSFLVVARSDEFLGHQVHSVV